jgi:hypothetical protein
MLGPIAATSMIALTSAVDATAALLLGVGLIGAEPLRCLDVVHDELLSVAGATMHASGAKCALMTRDG